MYNRMLYGIRRSSQPHVAHQLACLGFGSQNLDNYKKNPKEPTMIGKANASSRDIACGATITTSRDTASRTLYR
jgi:hypothetical protein